MENIILRDRAALSALMGLVVNEDLCIEKTAKIAYEYADAFMAARELENKTKLYSEKFQKENEDRKTRVENSEKLKKALEPFYEYAKNNNLSRSCIHNFTSDYKYSEGDDVIAIFKEWENEHENMHVSLAEEFKKLRQQGKDNEK